MELFVVPTNRRIDQCIQSLIMESNSITEDNLILIIDNSNIDIQKHNKKIIEENKKFAHNILWINLVKQKVFIELLAKESNIDKAELLNLLYADHCDYGKIFNIIYLFAVALGFDSFHRRDSDCYVSGESETYPVHMEMKYLNKKIIDTDIKNYCPSEYSQQDKIYAVGSDYTGNWNLDFHYLSRDNNNALKYLYSLSNIPKEYQNEYIKTKYLCANEQFYERPMFDYEKNFFQWAEMGNISMVELFKIIPNFIGKNAIGFDYNVFNLATPFRIPTVYHPNKIEHRHDEVRKEFNNIKHYWKGIFKMNDYNLIMNDFANSYNFDHTKNGFDQLKNGMKNGDIIASFDKIIHELSKDRRYDVMDTITEKILNNDTTSKYSKIRNFLKENTESIFDETYNDYIRSLKLMKIWNKLIDICECSNKVKKYINEIITF